MFSFLFSTSQGRLILRPIYTLFREISSNLESTLNGEVFQKIISQTFISEIDLLASRLNAKTAKFISWHPQPGAVAIDAFSLSWANELLCLSSF